MKLKTKQLAFCIAFALVATSISAQGVKLGIKAGANVYKIDDKSFSNEFKWGYHIGGMAQLMFSKKWGIQPEVLFVQTSTKTGYSFDTLYNSINPGTVKNVKLDQLSIPVLINWRPISLLMFQAGPQFSILMAKDQNLLQNGKSAFKNGNVALLGGVELNLLLLRIYGRYGVGITNVNNINSNDKWKSSTIQVGAAITL
jgi:hypothetical protein